MTEKKIAAFEVAGMLKAIASGDSDIRVSGGTWNEVFAGNVAFIIDEKHTLVIFNDCDDFDYVDCVTMDNGRLGDFDDWLEMPPDEMLTEKEYKACLKAFREAG